MDHGAEDKNGWLAVSLCALTIFCIALFVAVEAGAIGILAESHYSLSGRIALTFAALSLPVFLLSFPLWIVGKIRISRPRE
jgi:hypothetical protein